MPIPHVTFLLLVRFDSDFVLLPDISTKLCFVSSHRWSFPENEPFLQEEFGRIAFPKESSKDRRQVAEMAYGRFKGMLPTLGITETTAPGGFTAFLFRKKFLSKI